jgi:hypothetical protein
LSYNFLILPGCRRRGAAGAQEDGLKCGLAKYEIEQCGIVRLDEEEEDLFERNVEERRPDDDMARVAPDTGANKVRVPWYCCGDSDLALLLRRLQGWSVWTYDYKEGDLKGIESGKQRPVQQSKQHGRRYGVLGMAGGSGSVCASCEDG